MSKKESWQQHINACGKSDLSARAYCRQKKLSYGTFMNWKKKLADKSNSDFISLDEDQHLAFHIGDIPIRVDKNISSQDLSRLIAATKIAAGLC